MITDAMLQAAAGEAERSLLTTLPSGDAEEHRFSSRFERKMAKLIRRVNHPVQYQVIRYVAAIILVLLTLFGAVLAISPEARASVAGWVRSTFSVYSKYEDHTPIDPNARYVYCLSEVPDGYALLTTIEEGNGQTNIYTNDAGGFLQFSYIYSGEGNSFFVETDDYDISAATVGQCSADLYIARNSDETNMIVWEDPSEGVLFFISAMLDRAALIELAESVEKS